MGVHLPLEVPIFLLVSYFDYLYFISWGSKVGEGERQRSGGAGWVASVLVGLVGMARSAELISWSSEYMVHAFHLNVVIAATVIGLARACSYPYLSL